MTNHKEHAQKQSEELTDVCAYLPTPEQIKEATARIRASWAVGRYGTKRQRTILEKEEQEDFEGDDYD